MLATHSNHALPARLMLHEQCSPSWNWKMHARLLWGKLQYDSWTLGCQKHSGYRISCVCSSTSLSFIFSLMYTRLDHCFVNDTAFLLVLRSCMLLQLSLLPFMAEMLHFIWCWVPRFAEFLQNAVVLVVVIVGMRNRTWREILTRTEPEPELIIAERAWTQTWTTTEKVSYRFGPKWFK